MDPVSRHYTLSGRDRHIREALFIRNVKLVLGRESNDATGVHYSSILFAFFQG
jgi:hypothetical protein